MNIENCKVGMKVKAKNEKHLEDLGIEKNKKYTIEKIVDDKYINFGGDIHFNPNYFEPANKFEVGMRVKVKKFDEINLAYDSFRGKIYKVKNVDKFGNIKLEGEGDIIFDRKCFEPVSEFKVGDEVVYHGQKMEAKIEVVVPNVKKPYGISYITPNGEKRTAFTKGKLLKKRKKKDELEKDDKFIDVDGNKVRILNRYKDDIAGVKYCGVIKTTNKMKYISIWELDQIEEIIYD